MPVSGRLHIATATTPLRVYLGQPANPHTEHREQRQFGDGKKLIGRVCSDNVWIFEAIDVVPPRLGIKDMVRSYRVLRVRLLA